MQFREPKSRALFCSSALDPREMLWKPLVHSSCPLSPWGLRYSQRPRPPGLRGLLSLAETCSSTVSSGCGSSMVPGTPSGHDRRSCPDEANGIQSLLGGRPVRAPRILRPLVEDLLSTGPSWEITPGWGDFLPGASALPPAGSPVLDETPGEASHLGLGATYNPGRRGP